MSLRFSSHKTRSLVIITVIAITVLVTSGQLFHGSTDTRADAQFSPCHPVSVTPITNKSGQIIGSFPCATYAPTPTVTPAPFSSPTRPVTTSSDKTTGSCSPDGPRDTSCSCPEPMSLPVNICPCANPQSAFRVGMPSGCWNSGDEGQPAPAGCNAWCIAKPVIYLYPTKTTYVNVQVKTQGTIVVSNPLYPPDGWKHVLAHPDGALAYNGNFYNELFYESSITTISEPSAGIVIPIGQLDKQLSVLTYTLGLIPSEQKQFNDYWVPRLQSLHSAYIFFSLLSESEKERADHIEVSPRPDTVIEFIAFFKPLYNSFIEEPLLYLPKRPIRTGFTVVEWGGTIAKE